MSDDTPQKRAIARPPVPRGRRFGEGQVGNPGGRPKAVQEVVEACRALTPQALKRGRPDAPGHRLGAGRVMELTVERLMATLMRWVQVEATCEETGRRCGEACVCFSLMMVSIENNEGSK
jgi:hypothetical protein